MPTIVRPSQVYDFTAHARRQPTTPPPGDRIDAQLANHADAITAVQIAVEKLIASQTTPVDVEGPAKALLAQVQREAEAIGRAAGYAQALADQAQLQLKRVWAEADRARDVADRSEARLAAVVQAVAEAPAPPAPTNVAPYASLMPVAMLGPNTGGFYAGDDAGATATSADYAQVAIEWAEHMPDTIPPNILAVNAISGQHWSSRWWASRAAGAFGMLAWWYMGAFYDPGPPSTPYTPTGDPIPVGAMYFNLTHNVLMVWNGSAWVSTLPGSSKTVTQSLYYHATAGQTLFPLTTNDLYGHNFTYNQTITEGTQVIVAGDRVEPSTFSINTATSVVTFHAAVNPAGTLVVFDILTPPSEFSAGICLVNPIPVDGTTTTFGSLTIVAGGTPVNATRSEDLTVSVDGVIQEPVVMYSAFGDSITFVTPPGADSEVFMVWFGPVAGGGGGGGGGGGTPSNLLPLMDANPALVGTSLSFARGDHRHPTDASLLPIAGGTMTGSLILAGDPAVGLEAATKNYVDVHLGGGGGGGGVILSPTPPVGAKGGQLWFDDSDTGGQLYVYYDDGNSAQWVIVTNEPGPPGPAGPAGAAGAPGPTAIATTTTLGAVIPDGSTIAVSGAGVISVKTVFTSAAPPLAATWTAKGAGGTLTDVANGLLLANTNAYGSNYNVYGASRAVPATPYTIDARIRLTLPNANASGVGIGWTDGTKLQALIAGGGSTGSPLAGPLYRVTSFTGFAANTYASDQFIESFMVPHLTWLRIRDDGTNITLSLSHDGLNFLQLYTVAKASGYLGASGYSNLALVLMNGVSEIAPGGTALIESWWVH